MTKPHSNPPVQMEFVMYEDGRKSHKRLVVNDPESYNLVNKKVSEAYKAKLEREASRLKDSRGNFVIGKNKANQGLESSDITVSDRRQFMQLVLYARFGDQPLERDGAPLNAKDIADIWGVARQNASAKLNKFVKLGLIKKVKNGRNYNFVLNTEFFSMGKGSIKNGEKFVKLFQNKLAEIIDNVKMIENVANKNPRRKKKIAIMDVIGLLHAVMPYFHYQTYYLVSNPDDDICDDNSTILEAFANSNSSGHKKLKHLTKSQIGRILGYANANRATIDRYMDYLQQAGAVMVLKNKNRTRYLIHPDLMFRLDHAGTDEYTRYVRALFGQHDD